MARHMPTVVLNTGSKMPILVLGVFAGGDGEASVVERYLRYIRLCPVSAFM